MSRAGLGSWARQATWPRLVVSGGCFLALLIATLVTAAPGAQPERGDLAGGAVSGGEAVARGRALFMAKGCAACHAVGGGMEAVGSPSGPRTGPDLTALPAVAGSRRPGVGAEAYVRESIVAPQAFVVPGYSSSGGPDRPAMPRLQVSADDVEALVAFLLAPRSEASR